VPLQEKRSHRTRSPQTIPAALSACKEPQPWQLASSCRSLQYSPLRTGTIASIRRYGLLAHRAPFYAGLLSLTTGRTTRGEAG
jgi:hypothetical protein